MLEVREVATSRDLADFIEVPWAVYANDGNWVAPLRFERRRHFSARNPFFGHVSSAFFVAYRGNRAVGRISVQLDPRAQGEDGARIGHFGFLEADTPEVMLSVLKRGEAWLRTAGCTIARGPFSLSSNDESGLLVEGGDRPPRIMMNYAPSWYEGVLSEAGYRQAKDLLAFRLDLEKPLPPAANRLAEDTGKTRSVIERPLDPRRFREDLREIVSIYNDAWSQNWGFVPIAEDEAAYLADNLKPILQPELVRIAEVDGQPAAMIVAVPDANRALAGLDGRLLPLGWLRLLWRMKIVGLTEGRVLMMGVRQSYRGNFLSGGLAALLMARLHTACREAGFREIELSWILDDNKPMCRIANAAGGVADKRYRVFEKDL